MCTADDIGLLWKNPGYIPAFTRGCDQLGPSEVNATGMLAKVRIYVEGVIDACYETAFSNLICRSECT